jgi:hypothetical protein
MRAFAEQLPISKNVVNENHSGLSVEETIKGNTRNETQAAEIKKKVNQLNIFEVLKDQ